MKLFDINHVYYNKSWVDEIAKKYDIYNIENKTQNIYGCKENHHLGIFDTCMSDRNYKLTAGMHIHFSRRKKTSGDILDLPIKEIVRFMDDNFEDKIKISGRISGEWEPKKYGFEYRSLPCDIDMYKVLPRAFEALFLK